MISPMLKHHFTLSHPALSSLQLPSEPEGIRLPLYSLKHEQVQSLQEAEHPCQKQQEHLSLKCYCHATVAYPGLQHTMVECLVPWESAPVIFSKPKRRLCLLKIFILTGESWLIFCWAWCTGL